MTDEPNPYAAPKTVVVGVPPVAQSTMEELVLLAEPRKCRAGEGGDWVAQGWELFRRRWDVLLVIMLLMWMLNFLVSLVPYLGGIVSSLFSPVLTAGLLLAIRQVEQGGSPKVDVMFAGFSSPRFGALVLLGGASFLMMLAIFLVLGLLAVAMFGTGILSGQMPDPASLGAGLFLLMAVFAVILFVYIGVLYFSVPLVFFHGLGVVDALRLSLKAVLRNWASLTLYGLIAMGLMLASVLTLFLGLLVVMPLMMAAYYRSYRIIFTQP